MQNHTVQAALVSGKPKDMRSKLFSNTFSVYFCVHPCCYVIIGKPLFSSLSSSNSPHQWIPSSNSFMTTSPMTMRLHRTMQFPCPQYQQIPSNVNHHLHYPGHRPSRYGPPFNLSSAVWSSHRISFFPLSAQLSTPALLLSQPQSSQTSFKNPISRVTLPCIGPL